ncbi:MAG: hypothetical protein HY254_16780 [Burkholderiales bacterium]|nr:hypothetical protein [Burkholderiales bacterium]
MVLLSLFKRPNIRTILIALVLLYLIGQFTSLQYMRNMLGLPVLLWIPYSFYSNYRKARQAHLDMIKAIRDMSQVTDESCIDICGDNAMAINYNTNTLFLIDGKTRKTVPASQFLRWEMTPAGGGEITGVVVGGSTSTPQGQAVLGAAMGAGIFYVLINLFIKRKDIGFIKFWINDAERSIVSVYVSKAAFVDQLEHFTLTIGHKI